MEASKFSFLQLPPPQSPPPLPPRRVQFEPDAEKIKQKLLKKGVYPTPKIVRNLSKKEIQKHNRKAKKQAETLTEPPLTDSQIQSLNEEIHFQTVEREYRSYTRAIAARNGGADNTDDRGTRLLVGKPWEKLEKVKLKELAGGVKEDLGAKENLRELREILEKDLNWVLDDDVDVEGVDLSGTEDREWSPIKRWRNEGEAIDVLVNRLSNRDIDEKHCKFVRIMKQSGLEFTENHLLKIVQGLGDKRSWKQAWAVVRWVYSDKKRNHLRSRFVYTKLLSILGDARRPQEALSIYKLMLGDRHLYPDLAAYHCIAVTLGQAGYLKELLKVIEGMRQKPFKIIKNDHRKNWDPVLEPDLVVYNAVLNSCVPLRQWKGVSWVFAQLRKSGQRPNGATYGLAMEVMLESGKYDLVHDFFGRMKRSGEAPRAITYKVVVRAFWKEGKIDEAIEAVRDMERKGVIGTSSIYYELGCCLCNNGRWRDAMIEVENIKMLRQSKPLEITFTGFILSAMDGGHISDCISIFHYMKDHCRPNTGTINTMLKVYGKNDMFSEAKELFEEIKRGTSGVDADTTFLVADEYTFSSMLEASARALQWEYFEYVYKEMTLSGFKLDQTKHASLLVEASRVGKWYLLEHAFDSLIENGEIPHPLFFTEMLCQATAREDYERAVSLVKILALAPFQVQEREWTKLFATNNDRIKQKNLENLLDALSQCDYVSEISVSNLLTSLNSLCGLVSSDPIVETKLVSNGYDEIGTAKFCLDNKLSDSENYLENELSILSDELKMPMDEVGESRGSNKPSALEILEGWKQSRIKDGSFFRC